MITSHDNIYLRYLIHRPNLLKMLLYNIDVYNAIPFHDSKKMSQKIRHLLLIEAMHFIRYIVKRLAFLCQHIMGSVHIFSRLKYVLGLCFFLRGELL